MGLGGVGFPLLVHSELVTSLGFGFSLFPGPFFFSSFFFLYFLSPFFFSFFWRLSLGGGRGEGRTPTFLLPPTNSSAASSPFIVPSAQHFTVPGDSLSSAPVSTNITNSDNCLFLSVFAHPAAARFNRSPIILQWSVGSMVSRKPILHICNAVVVLKQKLASFQHLHRLSR